MVNSGSWAIKLRTLNRGSPVSRFEFTRESSLQIGQWTICLAEKTARQNTVTQSENDYGWDNHIAIKSNKCFETRDTNEKIRLACGVTAAHWHDHVRVPSPMIGQYKLHSLTNSIRDNGFESTLIFEVWAISFSPRRPGSLTRINECSSADSLGNMWLRSSRYVCSVAVSWQLYIVEYLADSQSAKPFLVTCHLWCSWTTIELDLYRVISCFLYSVSHVSSNDLSQVGKSAYTNLIQLQRVFV